MSKTHDAKRTAQNAKGLIFVISGPSGSGKTTLRDRLLEDKILRKRLAKPISFTTRPKRSKEQNGRDYYFINRVQFEAKKRAKKILEWTRYLGYYYATPKDYVQHQLRRGRDVVLCTDLKGVANIKRLYPFNNVSIFVRPPSLGALEKRITGRCHKTGKKEIKKRIGLAEKELRKASSCDYQVLNKRLSYALARLKGIVVKHTTQKNRRG
ncbi:MAG: guanylate kinase [Candidatus Omnitrophota bacterium]